MTVSNRAERAALLNGVVERRSVELTDFELRADDTAQTLNFRGYPSLFGVGYDMYGGPDKGGWTEFVDPKAFDRTLSAKPDVVLNMNHGNGGTGLPIARTTSGTLSLQTDAKGLVSEAPNLDLRDPDVMALHVKGGRGDLNQMSFAFRTIRQEWRDDEGNLVTPDEGTKRYLMELSLDRGDVSIVTNGANPGTSFQLRNLDEIAAALAAMDFDEAAAEVRSLDPNHLNDLRQAYSLLGRLTQYAASGSVMGVATKCPDCNGSGMCQMCNGGGYTYNSADDGDYGEYGERAYSEADRKKMAKSGEAMPDGSYPIANLVDLHNAIHAVGRGSANHDAIRRHIMARAKALNAGDVIPTDWNADGSVGQKNSLTLAQAKRLATMDAR